jgi:hypothetical protein
MSGGGGRRKILTRLSERRDRWHDAYTPDEVPRKFGKYKKLKTQ